MDASLIIALIAVIGAGLLVAFMATRKGEAGSEARIKELSSMTERLIAAQAELTGRLRQMDETQAAAQTRIRESLEQRLDSVSKRLGDGLGQHTEKTLQSMNSLQERLAVIDAAQKKITSLSEQVVGLQDILSNKQARGAFGEIQLNDIVESILPPSAYAFQVTLGNKKIADCLLTLPNPPGAIAIDAKFPLESYAALQKASNEAEKIQAQRNFSADVKKHIRDISEKYIVPGETAESALMFLPSEAVYAELHANFRNIVEEGFRHKVWIVSPTTLMATLNTVRAILKDVRMREQADVIQAEVATLLVDVSRLDKRVENLQGHFHLAEKDIDEIKKSSKKITSRGDKIEDIQLGDEPSAETLEPPQARD
jgi:DNA recombination protein RmuC